MKTLSDRIVAAAEALGPQKDNLGALEKQLSEMANTFDAEKSGDEDILAIEALTAELDELRPKVASAQKQLDALRAAEAQLANRAAQAPAIVKRIGEADRKPGELFIRSALVTAMAHAVRQPIEAILDDRYGDDDRLKAVMSWKTKTAVAPADTTTATWAAELVRDDVRGFLDMLKNRSIGAGLAMRSLMLDFAGANTVTIPRMNQIDPSTQTEPAWVGEGGVIPLQRFSFGATVISRYKLASIVPLTMELVEQATPQAETIMRSGMEEAYALMLDGAILSAGAAVAGIRPAGLLNGVSVGTGDATGGYESVVADIKTLLASLTSAGLGKEPVLILNDEDFLSVGLMLNPLGQLMFKDEVGAGRLLGIPVLHSLNATNGTAIMIEASALATAFDGPRFAISQEATLTMANADGTAPTQALDGSGGVGTAGQVQVGGGISVDGGEDGLGTAGRQAVSMFQTYQEAIRGIWPTSWALLRPGAVAALDNLSW